LGRLLTVTDALGQVTKYSYDEVGDRISQTDANNHATSYAYNRRGRRTQRTLPLGQAESYSYDAAGNLTSRTDFNGKTTTYSYDAGSRLLQKTPDASFGAPPVKYTYSSSNGLRLTMTDASGTTNYIQYDGAGRLLQVAKPAGTLSYAYDLAGNLTPLSGAGTVSYTYDAVNRLSTVVDASLPAGSNTSSYTYDVVGNLQTVTYTNGVVHSYNYDNKNRLTNLAVNKAATAIASYTYTLDAAGHRTSVTELSGRKATYAYDNLYRLTSETIASDPGGQNGTISYVYDPVGNRKQMTSTVPAIPAGLWNYDANDRSALPPAISGFSIARGPDGRVSAVSLFAVAWVLFGSDANIRRTLLELGRRHNWDLKMYEQATEVLQDRDSLVTHHGIIAWIAKPEAPVELRIGLTPPEREDSDCSP